LRRDSLRRKLEAAGLSPGPGQEVLGKQQPVESLPVRGPLARTVVRFNAILGQVVKAEEPTFEIHDSSHLWARGFVRERQVARVRTGQPARVRLKAYPELVGEARLVRSGQVFGAEDRTLSVWAELPPELRAADRPLLPNMLARLTVVVGE